MIAVAALFRGELPRRVSCPACWSVVRSGVTAFGWEI